MTMITETVSEHTKWFEIPTHIRESKLKDLDSFGRRHIVDSANYVEWGKYSDRSYKFTFISSDDSASVYIPAGYLDGWENVPESYPILYNRYLQSRVEQANIDLSGLENRKTLTLTKELENNAISFELYDEFVSRLKSEKKDESGFEQLELPM